MEHLFGAFTHVVAGLFGFFAKELWSLFKRRVEVRDKRIESLKRLARELGHGRDIYFIQERMALDLAGSIARRDPSLNPRGDISDAVLGKEGAGLERPAASVKSYDELFRLAWPGLSDDERRKHKLLRQITAGPQKEMNIRLANWIREDDFFSLGIHPRVELQQLAEVLKRLKEHLAVWNAKFIAHFEPEPSAALNFLGDPQRDGPPFPREIDDRVGAALQVLEQ